MKTPINSKQMNTEETLIKRIFEAALNNADSDHKDALLNELVKSLNTETLHLATALLMGVDITNPISKIKYDIEGGKYILKDVDWILEQVYYKKIEQFNTRWISESNLELLKERTGKADIFEEDEFKIIKSSNYCETKEYTHKVVIIYNTPTTATSSMSIFSWNKMDDNDPFYYIRSTTK